MSGNVIHENAKDMADFRREMRRLEKALTRKEINSVQRTAARPMLRDMKNNAPSFNIAQMTAVTTRQTKAPKAPRIGIRIGVINNDAAGFPKFSAPALASVLEHGTGERFRVTAKMFGITIGAASTGKVKASPWLRPAWDRNVRQLISRIEQGYIRRVER